MKKLAKLCLTPIIFSKLLILILAMSAQFSPTVAATYGCWCCEKEDVPYIATNRTRLQGSDGNYVEAPALVGYERKFTCKAYVCTLACLAMTGGIIAAFVLLDHTAHGGVPPAPTNVTNFTTYMRTLSTLPSP